MKVLIVGLGYAGTRLGQAFRSLWAERNVADCEIAYVGRTHHRQDIRYFESLTAAIAQFSPDIIILSVNDVYRADVSEEMSGFPGFVICEKPFTCPWDDLQRVSGYFASTSGLCLNLVERYSTVTDSLRGFIKAHDLELLRANFTWGKDRIGDHRPTCGVTSEIIHPLDIVRYVSSPNSCYQIKHAHGVRSDFSISGPDVVDSVAVLAGLGGATVSGYASFVNASRRREIGFIFTCKSGKLVFANLIFDDRRGTMTSYAFGR